MLTRDTDTRFSSDTDFSEDFDGRSTTSAKGKVVIFNVFTVCYILVES